MRELLCVFGVVVIALFVWYHIRGIRALKAIQGKRVGLWVGNEDYDLGVRLGLDNLGVSCRRLDAVYANLLAAPGGFWRNGILAGQTDLDMVVTITIRILHPINHPGHRRYDADIKAFYTNGAPVGEFTVEYPEHGNARDVEALCARVAHRIARVLHMAVETTAPDPGFRYDPKSA